MSLSNKALLVSLTISQWGAKKEDKNATATVAATHNTGRDAGGFQKNLLPGSKELKDIGAKASQIRKFFHEKTLPWMSDGSRIIPAQNHLEFAQEFLKMKNDFEDSVRLFSAAYPNLQTMAQNNLGNLYNPSEYPSNIMEKFGCEIVYLPMPNESDFRISLSDKEKENFQKKMKETESAAMLEVWNRLHKVVKNAAEKLADPDAIFRDSLVENIQEIVGILPSFNLLDDPNLEKSRRDVESLVNSMGSIDSLRDDKNKRQDTAKALKDVMESMGAFMGASS